MNATKFTVYITVDVLSLDSVPALVGEVANEQLSPRAGSEEGRLRKADGDEISWRVKKEEVDF